MVRESNSDVDVTTGLWVELKLSVECQLNPDSIPRTFVRYVWEIKKSEREWKKWRTNQQLNSSASKSAIREHSQQLGC